MYVKEITYTDYNGTERTEKFYFNLSLSEITEMELSTSGGLAENLMKIVKAKDVPTILKVFKDIIFKAYGEKDPDGKRFVKSEELSKAFSQTEAYNQFFMEIVSNADKAAEFINGIIPADLAEKAKKLNNKELIGQ